MTLPTAANDNVPPRSADSFTALAERRAWLATLPTKVKRVLAWPTAERLARLESPDAAQALYRYAELMAPMPDVLANDSDPAFAAPESELDMRHAIRPGIGEILTAASDGLRCRVTSSRSKGRWSITSRHDVTIGPGYLGYRFGQLLFRAGALTSYGCTGKGRIKTPIEQARQPKGSKPPPARSETNIRFLLPANDNTPIAEGAGWLGGVTRFKGNVSKPDTGEHEAALRMARTRRQSAIRSALGIDAMVLDAAITDASARHIGEAFGYMGKRAERQGIARINDAIRNFQQIAA